MTKPTSRAEAALDELCVGYGYCISGDAQEAILANPPDDPDAFLDAVLLADGYAQPRLMDQRDREPLREVVCEWLFDDGRGRGTRSGLPRLPSD